jgi:hypothetical protein
MRDKMDTFCLNCHDDNGSSTIAVNNANTGLFVGTGQTNVVRTVTGTGNSNTNAASAAQRPFNTNDQLKNSRDANLSGSTTPTIGTFRLTTYGRVVNVKGQFNSGNAAGTGWASHHNLNQYTKRYTTRNTTALTNAAFTSYTTMEGQVMFTAGETAGLHCSDCHLNEANAHGSANAWYMLQGKNTKSTTADVAPTIGGYNGTTPEFSCYRCHNPSAYTNSASTAGRYNHNNCTNVSSGSGTSNHYPFGNMCHACHGGFGNTADTTNRDTVGTGTTKIGRGALGAIHGNNENYNPGNGATASKRYRFMSGASMRFYNPNGTTAYAGETNWTNQTTGGCYTISSADVWGSCTQHSSGRSTTTNRTRALTY